MAFISLGFSCQARLSIDAVAAGHPRHPFDFTVVTRDALLTALDTMGANFRHGPDTAEVFSMRASKRQGVHAGGIHFWHDYPVDAARRLAATWEASLVQVNEKYAFLWQRLRESLADAGTHRTFVCANAQHNLVEFADGPADFQRKFGLDRGYVDRLIAMLERVGGKDFRLVLLHRGIEEAHALAAHPDPRVESRFWGSTSLPTSRRLAMAALAPRPSPAMTRAALARIRGGWATPGPAWIDLAADDRAFAWRHATPGAAPPWAEVTALADGYLFVFDGGTDRHVTAVLDDGALSFPGQGRWARA